MPEPSSSPRYKNNHYNGRSSRSTTRQWGLFVDGVWKCDCEPPQPANHFRVKKDGKNHGRWFYTCDSPDEQRCGFFLWEDDAKLREESAVLANSRTEPGRGDTQRPPADDEVNPVWAATQITTPTAKRKASPPAPDDGASTASEPDGPPPSWPATASSKRHKADAYPTPDSGGRARKPPWPERPDPTTPSRSTGDARGDTSPTPARFHDALAASPPPTAETTLTDEVMALLPRRAGSSMTDAARAQVRAALGRFELKMRGAVRGRELVRAALAGREAKVVELRARVAGLEAEVDVLRRSLGGRVEEGGEDVEL